MTLEKKISTFTKLLNPLHIQLIAVSKTKTIEEILEAYHAGQRIFGENQVQELVEKYEVLPKDIEWHFIGHLQTNKVKPLVPFIKLIQSVDSLRLLEEINKQATKIDRVVDCLLEVHIAEEETKYGLTHDALIELLRSEALKKLTHVRITGLMAIASNTPNQNQVQDEFYEFNVLFKGIKESFFRDAPHFSTVSIGMSSDYKIAIENGSTMIRIGSGLFGQRSKTSPDEGI